MVRESGSNIGLVCPEHAPQPGKYAGRDPKDFMGNYVKVALQERGTDRKERLWVVIDGIEDGKLTGLINNDPVLDIGYKCDDRITISVGDIIEVFEE